MHSQNRKNAQGTSFDGSSNVGDALTYYIYDDQSKPVVNASVVRPYTSNNCVTWDASTLDTVVRPRLQEPITKWGPAPNNHDTMNEYDHD